MRRLARKPLPDRTRRALDRASNELTVQLARGENPEIGPGYKSGGIQRVLRDQMFEGACCYCEAGTEPSGFGHVDHHRPKGRAEFRHLAYSWDNLVWSCSRCNQAKGDDWDPATPLLDPCVDEPTEHLTWNDALVVGTSERGKYTVRCVDLNGERSVKRFEHRRDLLHAARLLSSDADTNSEARALLDGWTEYRGMLRAHGII